MLFDDLPEQFAPIRVDQGGVEPVWTQHKAQLIERYLRYFVFITKHGAYIDGFAGRKDPNASNSWAAKLVIESDPKRLKQFFLCELKKKKARELEALRDRQPASPRRTITVRQGDFNAVVEEFLNAGTITDKTATFCLLDQYSMECRWSTLERLAGYKSPGERKIELFYFLGTSWMARALAAHTKNLIEPELWCGSSDWPKLKGLNGNEIAVALAERFRDDLGYKFVKLWPIYKKHRGRGRIMFHMVHASDHPEAQKLMRRAYKNVLQPLEPEKQLAMEFG